MEGFPMRNWEIKIMILNENTQQLEPATCYEKCVYKLHPSFGARQNQTFRTAPFSIKEEGWGEFDIGIALTPIGIPARPATDHNLDHDLNFQQEYYEATHKVTFKNPKPELLSILAQTGPTGQVAASDPNGASAARKKSRKDKNVDMEKLAEGLQRLTEDDLLHVVQLVHDKKTADTYTKNDVENGEFHVDLFTLPDALAKELWDFCAERAE